MNLSELYAKALNREFLDTEEGYFYLKKPSYGVDVPRQ